MKTDRISGGIKQAATVHIIFSTDSLLLIWGEIETSHTSAAVSADEFVVCLMMIFLLLLFLFFMVSFFIYVTSSCLFNSILAKRINCTSGRLAGQT